MNDSRHLKMLNSLSNTSPVFWLRFFGVLLTALFHLNALSVEAPKPSVHPLLQAHQDKWYPPRIEHVAGPVHAAIGYSFSNIVFIEGETSVTVIDWGLFAEDTAAALAAYREITDKPIETLILTHAHPDHYGGIKGFFEKDIPDSVEIIGPAQQHIDDYQFKALSPNYKGTFYRGYYLQQGVALSEGASGTIGSGVAPLIKFKSAASLVDFTRSVTSNEANHIDGVNIDFIYAPADLEAHIAVWLPDYKVLIVGDLPGILYFSTPRLEPTRKIEKIIESNKRLSELPIEHMVAMHRSKVYRGDAGAQFLRDAHDLLKLASDQTYRAINNNQSPDDLVKNFPLPEKFANDPEFKDYYHKFSWMLRGLYAKRVGWFGGEMAQIVKPLGIEEARRIAKLAGGERALWDKAKQAYQDGDFGWVVQLADYLVQLQPNNSDYRQLKSFAQRAIAYQSVTANERHFLLTDAMTLEGDLDPLDSKLYSNIVRPVLENMNVSTILGELLPAKLRAEACMDLEAGFVFELSDHPELHTINIRHGVAIYSKGAEADAIGTVKLSTDTLMAIVAGTLTWDAAKERELVTVSGDSSVYSLIELFEW